MPKRPSDRRRERAFAESVWASRADKVRTGMTVRAKVLPPVILAAVCAIGVVVYVWLTG